VRITFEPGEVLPPCHEVVDLLDLDTAVQPELLVELSARLGCRGRPDLGRDDRLGAPLTERPREHLLGPAVHRRGVKQARAGVPDDIHHGSRLRLVFGPDVFALYDREVEIDLSRSGIPDGGVHHGHDGIREGWVRWRGAWDDDRFEVEDLTELGDRVLSLTRIRARSKGQGVGTEVRAGEVFTVRNGLIVHFVNVLDRDAALREAGVG
jgi:ketosteroid isomerase-like protein